MTATPSDKFKIAGVYIWFCKDLSITDEYIGYSKNVFLRISTHKSSVKNKNPINDRKLYNFIRDNGGVDGWEFNILEKAPTDFKTQDELKTFLIDCERKWIYKLDPSLNTLLKTN